MEIIAIVGTVVTSIVLGVAANLLTPKISEWINQRFTDFRSKTINQLNDEIAYITSLHNSSEKLIGTMVGFVLILVIFLTLLIICCFALVITIITLKENAFSVSFGILLGTALTVFGVMIRIAIRAFDILSELAHFEEYVDSAQKRITELERRNQTTIKAS